MPNTSGTTFRASLLTLLLASSAGAQRDTAFTWSRKLPDGAQFSIRNLSGSVEVRPGSSDRVEVRAVYHVDPSHPSDIGFDVRERAADDVEICTTEGSMNACVPEDSWSDRHVNVRYVVDLPRGLRFRTATGSGDVIVMQTANEIDVTTGSGDVVIRESLSRVSAATGSGDVTVAAANGPVRATTGNGRVLVNISQGPVTATSGNGKVEVRMISVAPNVTPQFTNVSSGNGDVIVTLPADFNGEIDADTGNGEIKSDFQVRASTRAKSRLRGTIGGGGPLVKLHSGNGRLEIRKG